MIHIVGKKSFHIDRGLCHFLMFADGLEAGALGVDIMSAPSVRTTPVVNLASHVRSHSDLGV